MTELSDTLHRSGVTVYWRPGCPYCSRLRRDLHTIGLPTTEVNIWENSSAAAAVRSAANGNETVPTVVIGATTLVNPSARAVVEAVRSSDSNQAVPADITAGLGPKTSHGEMGRTSGHHRREFRGGRCRSVRAELGSRRRGTRHLGRIPDLGSIASGRMDAPGSPSVGRRQSLAFHQRHDGLSVRRDTEGSRSPA
jgi:mycoredoxin